MTDQQFELFWREHQLPRGTSEDAWIQRGAAVVLAAGLLLGVYAVLALAGHVSAAPWSALA